MIAPPPAAAARVGGDSPYWVARMRRARQTGHELLHPRLEVGRRPGPFRAIRAGRGLFAAVLLGLRRAASAFMTSVFIAGWKIFENLYHVKRKLLIMSWGRLGG